MKLKKKKFNVLFVFTGARCVRKKKYKKYYIILQRGELTDTKKLKLQEKLVCRNCIYFIKRFIKYI
jgi:hypothetical protein